MDNPETFAVQFVRHINWQAVIHDFLSVWDRIEITKDQDGNVTVAGYGREEVK